MIAVDTSIVVAAFASWHEGHPAAAAILARKPSVPAHVLVTDAPLVLPSSAYLQLLARAAAAGIAGGNVYDAIVAATVLHAGSRLMTRDRRASRTYERLGVEFEIVT